MSVKTKIFVLIILFLGCIACRHFQNLKWEYIKISDFKKIKKNTV